MFLDDGSLTWTRTGRPDRRPRRWAAWTLLLAAVPLGLAACGKKDPPPVMIPNRTLGAMTIAVAPALNFSGAADFDAAVAADLMASELSYLQHVRVIPVSRVLATMGRRGRWTIESPQHAVEVAGQVGADAILVFAVTEYDPYDPPIVGIAAQLYAVRGDAAVGGDDALSGAAEGRPFPVAAGPSPILPLAQSQRVFDASHDAVVDEVKRFAGKREAGEGPWGWKRHLVSQRHYLRYCCYATVADLMGDHEKSTVGPLTLR